VASNVVKVDSGETTNASLEIVELVCNKNPAEYTIADTLAKCWVKIVPAVLEAAQA